MHRILQTVFWLAVASTLYVTLTPITVFVPGSDKSQHLITFGMLTLGAAAAYPRARLVLVGLALSGFGGAIEVLQPWFGRTGDMLDWFADSAGILIALMLVWTARKLLARPA